MRFYNMKKIKKIFSESRMKKCYFADERCSKKVIKAHSIQNNRILKEISENGMVISFYPDLYTISKKSLESLFRKRGRGITSVFTGFCSYHDEKIFHDIDNNDYEIGNAKQEFLFALRALTYELFQKESALHFFKKLIEEKIIKDNEFLEDYLLGLKCGIEDLCYYLEVFKGSLNTETYNEINSFSFTLTHKYLLAVSSALTPHFDLKGAVINDFSPKERLKPIFLSIFPQKAKTYIIFGWFEKHNGVFRELEEQIRGFEEKQKINILNNVIVAYIENFAVSPLVWNRLSLREKKEFESLFIDTAGLPPDKDFLLSEPKFNLFREITDK